jgi:hypothetical protein
MPGVQAMRAHRKGRVTRRTHHVEPIAVPPVDPDVVFCGKIGWAIAAPLYLLLDMSLQVHPEDRGLLLRFKFKRWWVSRVMQG